ncbi:MAG: tape measure protein [Clostridiaceae bacterium]|nr:tape measure protein [Clostridiaceae bacterium]MBW4860333.1 tape measure protein [Clostridiaceae bacterium]MBW4867220.1 tape measure protein [Clostridiaceae bacterium]
MADGSIKIVIEVDGKEVNVASKELDKLEEAGLKSGKGIKAAEDSIDNLSDSSAKAGASVKGAKDSMDDLGDSGSKTGKDLKSTDDAMGELSDSSINASSRIKGTSDSLHNLSDSSSKTGEKLGGVDEAMDGISDSSSKASSGMKEAADNFDGMSDSANEAADGVKNAKEETEGVGEGTRKASSSVKDLAVSLGLVKIASAAFDVLKASLDGAISRFDTLNQFPKVLQALGVSAEDSERAMQKLSDGIEGLPTTLDDIAASAQEMYTSFNDMDKATDTAVALNNALLGSGASAEQAKRGTQQYSKALQTGKVDMMMWNTLSETMDVGLIKIAEGFGYAGKSAKNDLYKALQNGTITLDEFNDKLIEVGTGTGVMAELAKENSLGIATSLTNLKNAAAKGIANIIDSFNKLSKEVTGKEISENIDSMKVVVNASFSAIQKIIEATTPVFKMFGVVVKGTISVVEALTPVIVGLTTAYLAFQIISNVIEWHEKFSKTMKGVNAATKLLTAELGKATTAQLLKSTATNSDTVATIANAKAMTIKNILLGVLTRQMTLSAAATALKTKAVVVLSGALKALTGPIGWVVIGLGALVTAAIGIVKWFKRSTEESKKLEKETSELGESTNTLTDSIKGNTDEYKNSQREIKATATANGELANKIADLAEKENKSASEKQLLNDYIGQLNESVDGLNLSYNEEADALNMSSEKIQARIDLMEQQTSYNEALERQVEIAKEQNEIDQQLDEINELREKNIRLHDEDAISRGELKKRTEELNEQENNLKQTSADLGEQQKETEEKMTTAMNAITEATKNGVNSQLIDYDRLNEKQKATIEDMKSTWQDYQEAATNMFDTLSDKTDITVQEMTANMEENQRIIGEWAENIAILAERGVDEGLLDTLREAGPSSAGHVNALVNASNEELSHLSEVFAKGGDTATSALSKSLGIEESGVMEAVGGLVAGTESSLRQKIEEADFQSVGQDVSDGLAKGIEDGSKNAETASKNVAKATEKAARDESETHSPSRVFKRIGTDITDGLALGINDGTNKVMQAIQKMFKSMQVDSANSFKTITKDYDNTVKNIEKTLEKLPKITQKIMKNMLERLKSGASKQTQAMRKLSKDLVSPFNSLQSKFNSIGRNAMSGLNAGLNAGRGRVMSTARSIANSVASTMQNALRIHSPSRVMKDDVGRWIPEGLAEGIEDKESVVYNALNKMSTNMMRFSTPEMALGVSGMRANASTISQFSSNNTTKTINNNNKPTIHIEKIENYSDTDVPRVLEESAWIMDRERRRLDD